MNKKYILLICVMLAITPLFSGCFEADSNIFTIVYQNIGDEIIYDITISINSTNPYSDTQTSSMTGTITSKVLGMKTIVDGFGYESNALETSTINSMSMTNSGIDNNFTTTMSQYFDVDSKTPIKFSTRVNSQMIDTDYSTEYDFFFTKKMSDLVTSILSFTPGVLIFSPNEIVSSFEGKSIKKGDTGTINIGSLELTWTAAGTEKVKGYDCIIIKFSVTSTFKSKYSKIEIQSDYTVWFTSSFPTLIKMRSNENIKSETTFTGGFFHDETSTQTSEKQKITEIILKSSSQGDTPINWGNTTSSYPENNVFGEYQQWDTFPSIGAMETSINFTPSDAVSFAQNNSQSFVSYLTEHPNAYALSANYEKDEIGVESWTFLYRDNTLEGYEIKISHDENGTSIISEENKTYINPGPSKDNLSQTLLTFSGMENILKKYTTYDSSQEIEITFVANNQDPYFSSETNVTGLFASADLYPTSSYSMSIGSLFESSYKWAVIDAENGQIIMLYSM